MYTPDNADLSVGGFLCLSRLSKLLFVRNAIFKSVCLNMLVMYSVSLPTCVKVAHLCLEVNVECCLVVFWGCCFCGVMGNEFLCKMFWMTLSSCLYSCSWRL